MCEAGPNGSIGDGAREKLGVDVVFLRKRMAVWSYSVLGGLQLHDVKTIELAVVGVSEWTSGA